MGSEANSDISQVFEVWRAEDGEMEACLDEVRAWMREVSQLGIPYFGEAATRLRPLHSRLVHHFGREYEMIVELAELHPPPSPEVDEVRRQSAKDHQRLLARLDDLIQRLNETEPPFASWQAAMDEVELFVDALEQHEEQESQSIKLMLPSEAHQTDKSKSS